MAPGRLVVLGSLGNETTESLVAAWRGLGVDVELMGPAEAVATLGPGDTVIGRLDVRQTLDGVEAGLLALLLLERRGVRVVNSAAALLAAHDKLRSARFLRAAGLPHPHTTVILPGGALPDETGPFVLKPRFGSWGRDVFWCETPEDVAACVQLVADRPWFRRHGVLVQAAIPPVGHDLRLVVAGGRIVGAGERTAAPTEWRTNVSLGGSMTGAEPTEDAMELARTAACAIGADLVGVDLLPVDGGHTVLELNGAVEFDQVCSLPEQDIYHEAARALGLLAHHRERAPWPAA